MHYLGSSYGYLIFSYEEHCLLVDVYIGTKVKPPKLPPNNNLGYFCGIGILTAPLILASSRLLLFSRASMFQWQVGTNSWSEHPLDIGRERVYQIVSLKVDIFVTYALLRLYTIRLSPQFSMREVAFEREFSVFNTWLVVSGDMLLMVAQSLSFGGSDALFNSTFAVHRLTFSGEPAKWMKMEKMENRALFVSLDRRNPTFCCMSPERWGGKSNCIYFARLSADPDETWTAVKLGQPVPKRTVHPMFYSDLWVFPSLIYGSGQ
ncbi:hypothetical protein ZWY2020_019161 [Hordeum vulgare]|nr:hypothetical protein ZWY2020_019161 [Hordeum vulgare]